MKIFVKEQLASIQNLLVVVKAKRMLLIEIKFISLLSKNKKKTKKKSQSHAINQTIFNYFPSISYLA